MVPTRFLWMNNGLREGDNEKCDSFESKILEVFGAQKQGGIWKSGLALTTQ